MKDEKELKDKELEQVSGGNMIESARDHFCWDFYKRAGVERVEAPWFAHNAYTFRGHQYNSRDELWKALDAAGIKPVATEEEDSGVGYGRNTWYS